MDRIEQRKKNWVDFMDMSTDQTRLLVMECSETMPVRPALWWEKAKERVEWSYERYMRQMENMEWLEDNTIPFLSMITGTEIFAEAFGCKVHKPIDNTPFALPMITTVKEAAKIKIPRLEDTKLVTLFEMADKLRDRAGPKALFSFPDLQTPMDIVALIWDKTYLFMAFYDEPEAVQELAAKVKVLLEEFLDQWTQRYGPEFIAHYPDFYMPTGITVSEDEVGSVSAELYREFFRNELDEIAERYHAIGVHCCANSNHQWENFKNIPNLKLLNIVGPVERLSAAVDFFQNEVPLYLGQNYDIMAEEVPPKAHIAMYVTLPTKKKALEYTKRFNEKFQNTRK